MATERIGYPEGSAERILEVDRRNGVASSLDSAVAAMLETGKYLLGQDKLWFPSDFLPLEAHDAIRDEASRLSPALLVLTVGNAVTESGISTYQTLISKPEGTEDKSGVDRGGHATWSKGWSAEEKRHDEVFGGYLRLSSRLDHGALDRTTYNLIKNGFNPRTYNDPYRLSVFAAIQEDVTATSHSRTGDLAEEEGAGNLAKISKRTAGDERRHGKFYIDFGKLVANEDPNGFVTAFAELLAEPIVLPAAMMTVGEKLAPDARTSNLFDDYDLLSEATGMLTLEDFAVSFSRHYRLWNIDGLTLSAAGENMREQLQRKIKVMERVAKIKQAKAQMARQEGKILNFPWLVEGSLALADAPVLAAVSVNVGQYL